jgi:hypothetical protein
MENKLFEKRKNITEKEKILDSLDAINQLADDDKSALLNTLEGTKIASSVYMLLRDSKNKKQLEKEYRENINLLKNFLKKYATFYSFEEKELPNKEAIATFIVGKDKESFENLLKASKEMEKITSPKNSYNFGIAIGYPQTAVEAFKKDREKNNILMDLPEESRQTMVNLPNEISNDTDAAFLNFFLSKNNWREEFKTVKEWAKTIKDNYPELYERRLRKYQTRRLQEKNS